MSRAPDPLDDPTVPQRSLVPQGDRAWIDRVIGGKYRVEGILGRGGMGIVLKARHLRLEEPVAIKVLHASLANDKDMAARMLREARAAVRLSSEHIVRVMDADTLEDGVPYLVLEYLEGTDVATLLRKRGGKLPPEEAVPIAEQACRALAEAHSVGIFHRDLKPANLFIVVRPDGRRVVKLVDFGVSKISAGSELPITRKGDIIGSPRYMAPEQIRGEELDGRADLWSMGIVLYEMLSGTSPFETNNFARTCHAVMREPHEPLAARCPDLPPGLAALVDRCLEKKREHRVPDAAALRDALAPFGPLSMRLPSQLALPEPGVAGNFPPEIRSLPPSGPGSSQRPGTPSGHPGAPESFALAADVEAVRTAVRRRRSRLFLALALCGLVLGLAAGVAVLARDPDAAHPSASGTAALSGAALPLPPEPPSAPLSAVASAPVPPPPGDSNTNSDEPVTVALPDGPSPASPLPARRPTGPAAAPSTTATQTPSEDPFGERRQ